MPATATRAPATRVDDALRALAPALRDALRVAWASPATWQGSDGRAVIESMLDALARLEADADTVLAALLHAMPALEGVLRAQGIAVPASIAPLVDGQRAAQQVWALHAEHPGGPRSEGLRRLLLAIVRDLRVVPILLASQLARMQHAQGLDEAARTRLARLTRDIHASLANRLGIWQLKWELEDLAFRHLEPETYQSIARLLDGTRGARERYIEAVRAQLQDALEAQGIRADVAGRPKHIFSIHRKMQRKHVPIGELYDLRAVRVLVDDVADCYAALGVVHAQWTPIPSEFDDYIARPKRNDYRSLHTAVVGPEGKTLEVQIRTHAMHRANELGVAAHWKYKEGPGSHADAAFEKRVAWMRALLDGEAEGEALAGGLEIELVEDRVYVLTPKGEVIDLPAGATPLDFAYHVHTEVGHRCRGAKVGGRIVPLDHVLHSGDRVEIMTAKTGEPRRDWLVASNRFLASSRSREKVRNWFHKLDRARNEVAGRELLEKELRRMGLLHADLAPARAKFNAASDVDLHVHVALGDIGPHQVARALADAQRPVAAAAPVQAPVARRSRPADARGFTVQGVGNLLVQMARCCQPVPGEAIAGYVTRGRGVSVHRADCATFARLSVAQPDRVLAVDWGGAGGVQEVDVEVVGIDRRHLLKDLTDLMAQADAHVAAMHSQPDRTGRVRVRLRLRVADAARLAMLLDRLRALPGVERARRP